MSERTYDPMFSDGMAPRVTIMDVHRNHSATAAHCSCGICEMARMMLRQQAKQERIDDERALVERLMKEWP